MFGPDIYILATTGASAKHMLKSCILSAICCTYIDRYIDSFI